MNLVSFLAKRRNEKEKTISHSKTKFDIADLEILLRTKYLKMLINSVN